jgi:hypothetical protein
MGVKTQARAQKTWSRGHDARAFWCLVCVLKLTRRGRVLLKGGFSLSGPILPTRSVCRFCASETLQKRSGDASVTLQKRSTSGLHRFLDVFIHHRRFHGQWARCCGALLARVRACLALPCASVRLLTPDTAPELGTLCLKFVWRLRQVHLASQSFFTLN